ncbi:N-carbamoyl-L-amino acid amidohydrolase [Shewanella sp. GutCb]|uniref:N-carbamoyl-L-amino acid amidohydrolase n=1 Tax=Shewanella sp. GutCb TaxID=2058315 RepID=UPI000C7A58BB|nr:N-carbamoyl-L-amino acid amidohydrolase [Shewanella sp. GutCb]PKG73117.1 N-carbamoyl-L-amino acid amidohydrolase [Shewanella sp. GutCb]
MTSPYTENDNRLADVVAAIQVMATYKFYKMDFSGWAKRIEGDDSKGEYWKVIFEQHPEFFRLGGERKKASLVWRRNYQKLYNVDREEKVTREEYQALTAEEKKRFSRVPLSNSDISTLINTAINIQSGELDSKKDSRWWISGAIGLLGVIVGAVVKAYAG